MKLEYRNNKELDQVKLQELFLSVGWNSGHFPELLQSAMRNSDAVYTAWDKERLIGLINAISDGAMNAYFPYLLVRPEYQGKGIGKKLVQLMLEHYRDCLRKTLIAYQSAEGFYKSCGFSAGVGVLPMSVSSI